MQRRPPEIVLIDDDPTALETLEAVLSPHYVLHRCLTPPDAELIFRKHRIDAAILDLHFPHHRGFDVLKSWRIQFPDIDIVLCSGESRVEKAIECLRFGAADYVVKPFRSADLLWIVRRVLEKRGLEQKAERLTSLVFPHPVPWIGSSAKSQKLMEQVGTLKKETQLNILLLGESGTGKEVIARWLHQQEDDSQRPFVVANMPAIPATLMESELFGVEKGAFTDAKAARPGKFELADGGDLFLDEIGDLPIEAQAKLLRTLQERQVERVGATRSRRIDFRVISATNRPLSALKEQGSFREDLLYRLSDMVLWLPPLRERKEDIPELANHFVKKYYKGVSPELPHFTDEALESLIGYSWPGNVRQLESTIKRALVFNRTNLLDRIEIYDPKIFDPHPRHTPSHLMEVPNQPYEQTIEDYERTLLCHALEKFKGNKKLAAAALRLPRATFYRKISELKVPL